MRVDPRDIELLDDRIAKLLRRRSVDDGLRAIDSLFLSAREIVTATVRAQYPSWPEPRVRAEVVRRMASAPE
jgi:hypothetical protein